MQGLTPGHTPSIVRVRVRVTTPNSYALSRTEERKEKAGGEKTQQTGRRDATQVVLSAAVQATGRSWKSKEPLSCLVGDTGSQARGQEGWFLQSGLGKSCPVMLGLGQVVSRQCSQLLKRFATLNIAQGALPAYRDV